MAIWRHKHEQSFTVLPNSLLRDPRLRLRDVGLLCYMLSLPEDWDFSVHGMKTVLTQDGETMVKTSLKNLEQCGYLRRRYERTGQGVFRKFYWDITDIPDCFSEDSPLDEKPLVDKPLVDKPLVDRPLADNRPQTKNILNKEQNNKETTNKEKSDKENPPTQEEIMLYFSQMGFTMDPVRFRDYYEALGWEIKGSPIRDWKALARNWQRLDIAKEEKQNGNHAEDPLPYIWTGCDV